MHAMTALWRGPDATAPLVPPSHDNMVLWTYRGLSRVEHDISRGYSHVGGRGCVRCVCNYGPLLQVSRSTQKLLALSQVSEQAIPGSDPRSQHPL